MSEDPLEAIILQTINGAIATIPGYLEEIKASNDTLKVKNPRRICLWNRYGHGIRNEWSNIECTRKTTHSRRSNESQRHNIQTHSRNP